VHLKAADTHPTMCCSKQGTFLQLVTANDMAWAKSLLRTCNVRLLRIEMLLAHFHVHSNVSTVADALVLLSCTLFKVAYVDARTHTQTHMHKLIYIPIHTYTHTHAHTHIHTYTHTHIHILTYTYTHTYIHIHTYTHTYTHIHTYTYTYIHVHTRPYILIYTPIHTRPCIHALTYTPIHTHPTYTPYIHALHAHAYIHAHT